VHAWRALGTVGKSYQIFFKLLFGHIFNLSAGVSSLILIFINNISLPNTQADYQSGQGTYIKDSYICASLVGTKRTLPAAQDGDRPRVEVIRSGTQPVIPAVSHIITARVISITPRNASVDILAVGAVPVPHRCTGVIRIQDVRATEIDKVQLHLCFRPGDLVRAEVISLGDTRSYFLSTAKNELGVVEAHSLAGELMIPISWQEMQCPKTRVVEARKVAKIDVADAQ
jgi:exosome complex component CSL4